MDAGGSTVRVSLGRRLFLLACAAGTTAATLAWDPGAFLAGLALVASTDPLAVALYRRGGRHISRLRRRVTVRPDAEPGLR
jgi:hypothetical protein